MPSKRDDFLSSKSSFPVVFVLLNSIACFFLASLPTRSFQYFSPNKGTMPVAEIFLSAFISMLFKNLASRELLDFARRQGIHDLMKNWTGMLLKIQDVLSDAEEKQIKEKAVKSWLDDLQDLAYDLDDILDEFATEALRHKLTMEPRPSSRSKVRALLPSPSRVKFNSRMRSNIEEIDTRLQNITKQRSELDLVKFSGGTSAKTWQRPATTSLVHEPRIYGRDEDKRKIIEFLLRDESLGDNKIGIIPIVGMPGVGKTTLAQMLYNEKEVIEHFDLKAWVCVSDEFDIMRITRAILESITSQTCDFTELDQVQVKLKQTLTGKKFLIVLDDIWNRNYNELNVLKSPFNDGAQGSKVMVTTRHREVASMMGTVDCHVVKQLSNDDCWSVLAQHAFKNRSIDANPNLESITRAIVEKCGGLPLAARTLGGLLQCKETDDEWDDILNSQIWDLSDEVSDILPALRLSYHHLPSHLKQCFAYCSVLPKDYEFEEEELVLLWMAEGFIQQPKQNKQMEDLGGQYFRELLSRSLFQPSSSGNNSTFVMHDLINDLARYVCGDICLRWEVKLEACEQDKKLEKARHLSLIGGYSYKIEKFEALSEAKQLRTFLPFGLSEYSHGSDIEDAAFLELLGNLRCLRVFSLSRYRIKELPSWIGKLKHLRYLDLSYNDIERLPESLGSLYNLETLILRRCTRLKKLPMDLGNLINLRHLHIPPAYSLEEMPQGIGKLTSLQTLSKFIVSKDNGFRIKELGNLKLLKGILHISGLENVVDPQDAREARLNDKEGLHVLQLEWSDKSDASGKERVEMHVLDKLQPHKKLKELTITSYCGSKFPTWIGDPLFSNMVRISLENCKNCTSLPRLGQLPSLKYLYIKSMSAIKHVGSEFYGQGCSKPFPLLETLYFFDMPEWENWFPLGVGAEFEEFTQLRELHIQSCPKLLGRLPNHHLPCLKELGIWHCPNLVVELPNLPALRGIRKSLELRSLHHLKINDVSVPDSFCYPNAADEVVLANTTSIPSSVTSLDLRKIRNLTSLAKWFAHPGFLGLKKLEIFGCRELVTLWQNEGIPQNCLTALRHLEDLTLEECSSLVVAFPEKGLPPTLKTLEVKRCNALQLLLTEWTTMGGSSSNNNNCSLEYLEVCDCGSLTNLSSSKGGLPSTLKRLEIYGCQKLESILAAAEEEEEEEEEMMKKKKKKINCPFLESIKISDCRNLKSLPDAVHHNNLRNLRELVVVGCNSLESLPEEWFPAAINLRKLIIRDCRRMKSVPHHWNNNNNNHLSSLQELCLTNSPAVAAAAGRIFSSYFINNNEGRSYHRLTNLTSLTIDGIKISDWRPPLKWGLFYRFSSLKVLRIGVEDMESFPEDGMLLPASLIELNILRSPNLEKLSSNGGFQNLSSLQQLFIHDCPRLASLPEEGLPLSLSDLWIRGCPILGQRCEREKGEYWPLIAHIPRVMLV